MSDEIPEWLPRIKTDGELKQLAVDVYHGHVFCDWMCKSDKDIRMVFMITAFMDEEQIKDFLAKQPSMIFEYMDKAGPRTVNGMPGFFSMQHLNRADHAAWIPLFESYRKSQQEFLDGSDSVD